MPGGCHTCMFAAEWNSRQIRRSARACCGRELAGIVYTTSVPATRWVARARVAHLDSWWDVRAAHRIHGRLDRRWLGSLRVSRETETLMYVSWLCKAASISGKDAAWVRESVDSRTWYRKYQAARKCRYSKDRPFDLAPGQDWRQHR